MKASLSIFAKISIAFSLLVAVLMLGILFVLYQRIGDDIGALTQEQNLRIASARADQIGGLLDKIGAELHGTTLNPGFVPGNAELNRAVLARYYGKLTQGQLTDEICQLLYADETGAYIASDGTTGSLSGSQSFENINNRLGDKQISEPVFSESLKEPVIMFTEAIRDKRGILTGVVGATVKLSVLSHLIIIIKMTDNGFGWLLQGNGSALAFPDPEQIMKLDFTKADSQGYRGMNELAATMVTDENGAGTFIRPDGVSKRLGHGSSSYLIEARTAGNEKS